MTTIVIACVGSPFGGDRLGHAVAEILRAHPALNTMPENLIRIESSDRPQLNLLSQIEGAELAIIVDAIQGGQSAGQLLHINPDQLLENGQLLSSHAIGVAEVLALGRELGQLPDQLRILGLTIDESGHWQPACEDLQNLADNVITEVMGYIAKLKTADI